MSVVVGSGGDTKNTELFSSYVCSFLGVKEVKEVKEEGKEEGKDIKVVVVVVRERVVVKVEVKGFVAGLIITEVGKGVKTVERVVIPTLVMAPFSKRVSSRILGVGARPRGQQPQVNTPHVSW